MTLASGGRGESDLPAEWLRVRLRVRMVKGSTLTVGNFLSLENLNVIIRAIN